jgi:type II secretory pathway pseudopilin PulG
MGTVRQNLVHRGQEVAQSGQEVAHRGQEGFTLVEVMAATVMLVVGLLGVVAVIDLSNARVTQTKAREAATSLARQLVEGSRGVPYAQLTNNSVKPQLQAQPGLASAPGSPIYTIRRRGFTYSVDASVCSLDDPRDGIGSHTSGNFCRGGATGVGDGNDCEGAIAAAGGGGVDANGNRFDLSLCATVNGTLVWSACNLLNTTAAAQASGSLTAILGSAVQAEANTAATATVCGGGSAVGADPDPEDYKRVVVNVRWKARRTQQTTLLPNPGGSAGPGVISLSLNGQTSPVTGNPASLSFTATTNSTPAGVTWSLDGEGRGNALGSGTGPWDFTWDVGDVNGSGVVDGSYVIGTRAQDNYGVAGPGRSITVVLNRRVPKAPTGVAAGRNGSVVEIEWQPNSERDIVGYRAYRENGATDVLVCSDTTATSCRDTSPPAGVLQYYVVALDRNPADGSPREGDQSALRTVTTGNHAPNPPSNLAATASAGSTTLTWTAPLIGDIDVGDQIDFYRVYRDGQAYADRYDRTGLGTDTSYVDSSTGGQQHTYWVVAVDTQLAESTFVGPVTG